MDSNRGTSSIACSRPVGIRAATAPMAPKPSPTAGPEASGNESGRGSPGGTNEDGSGEPGPVRNVCSWPVLPARPTEAPGPTHPAHARRGLVLGLLLLGLLRLLGSDLLVRHLFH